MTTRMPREERVFALSDLEVRAEGDAPLIRGHAAIFNVRSEDLGGFREQIMPGAFKRTIKNGDIRALYNHDPSFVLGRTKADTLRLAEDERGLAVEIAPPDTTWARDLLETMRRGDVDQMSFGFRVVKDKWEDEDDGTRLRTLLEVQAFDVSVVTFPAYPQTDAAVRALLAQHDLDWESIAAALAATRRGVPLVPAQTAALRAARDVFDHLLPADSRQAAHSATEEAAPDRAIPLALYRRKLELLALR